MRSIPQGIWTRTVIALMAPYGAAAQHPADAAPTELVCAPTLEPNEKPDAVILFEHGTIPRFPNRMPDLGSLCDAHPRTLVLLLRYRSRLDRAFDLERTEDEAVAHREALMDALDLGVPVIASGYSQGAARMLSHVQWIAARADVERLSLVLVAPPGEVALPPFLRRHEVAYMEQSWTSGEQWLLDAAVRGETALLDRTVLVRSHGESDGVVLARGYARLECALAPAHVRTHRGSHLSIAREAKGLHRKREGALLDGLEQALDAALRPETPETADARDADGIP